MKTGKRCDGVSTRKGSAALRLVLAGAFACSLLTGANSAYAAEQPAIEQQAVTTGWSVVNGQWRWFENGALCQDRNREVFDPNTSAWYWLGDDSTMTRDRVVWVPSSGGKWCYFGADGKMAHGERYLSYDADHTGWYHFDEATGAMTYGVKWVASSGGKWVYYDIYTGQMAHGERLLNYDAQHNGWYLFDSGSGAMVHGWQYVSSNGGKWVYYDNATGIMAHGESYVTGDMPGWCYFDEATGAVHYGWKKLPDGRNVFYDEATGRMCYGWRTIGNERCYFNTLTGNLERRESLGGSTGGNNGGSGNPDVTGIVYWTPSGKSYHKSRGCRSLSRSKNVQSGTLQDAFRAGKTDPCNNCVR